jgi:hypothetical protein
VGASRKLSSVARKAKASTRFVLPWPFAPTMAVRPVVNSKVASS